MIIRLSRDRGHAEHGWLESFHTFSFADYHDRKWMGFRALRVINEDFVQPGQGFPTHAHRDMEILTWVIAGGLEHRDSLGNGSVIRPGELQYMSAGKGVEHSEFNPSPEDLVHLLQIWIQPDEPGGRPRYAQKDFAAALGAGTPVLLASPEGASGSFQIRADARLSVVRLPRGAAIEHEIAPDRAAWVQVARGSIDVNATRLAAGDGAASSDEPALAITAVEDAEVLLFDLA